MNTETPKQESTIEALKAAGWAPQALALLEGMPESVLAAELKAAMVADVWNADTLALLGTMTDQQLADQMGTTRGTVTNKRRRLGIEACGYGPFWTAETRGLLGKMTDTQLAKQIGISQAAVGYQRNKAGIPRYSASVQSDNLQTQ